MPATAASMGTAENESPLRNWLRFGFVFLLGLALGILLFMPWEALWGSMVKSMVSRMEGGAVVTWQSLDEAGPFGARFKGVRLNTVHGGMTLPEVAIRLGLFPLVKADINTGPVLGLSLGLGRTVSFDGGFELATLLPGEGVQGRIEAKGQLGFPSLSSPPQSGTVSMASQAVTVNGVALERLALQGALHGNRLNIDSLTVGSPLPLEAKGTADINWRDPLATGYNISGTTDMGAQKINFSRNGMLKGLLAG